MPLPTAVVVGHICLDIIPDKGALYVDRFNVQQVVEDKIVHFLTSIDHARDYPIQGSNQLV